MAKITISTGYWLTIYGYLNSMFTELYAAMVGKYTQTFNLLAGENTVITTTLTSEPYSILILNSSGKPITNIIQTVSMAFTGGVYVFTFYSTDALNNVKLKITY